MARKFLPAIWKRKEEVDLTQPPVPAKRPRQYPKILKEAAGYLAVQKAQTAVIEQERLRQKALGKLENVGDEIELERQETLLQLDVVKQKRDAIAAGGRAIRKQITGGSIPDGISEALDVGREDYNDD